ncbi:hypothetical protein [Pontibacter mangrovi]|uniref:DUF4595 domain-containing protein n=1 Tax=Pontibacter mangrovi TaxID=2589816 RepID=A0A501W4G1_9BACT|nr:hypothetical protein [Pontibacter mangrovi]TPE43535.1 hypothetical protein FJM65_12320 [Pontibacter mangrovi]
MKLRNKFMPAMLMLGVVAFSSCEKQEGEASIEPMLEQGMISHIMADSAEVTSYNFSGKQLSQVNHYDVETGDLESFEKYERDSKGRILKSSTYTGDSKALLSQQTFAYNTSGELTKSTMAYYSGSKLEYTAYATYDYDSNNKLEKKSLFEGADSGEEGKLKSFTTYEVLPNGNYTQEKQFVIDDNNDSKLFSTTTNSFDANANPFAALAEPGTASSPNNLVAATTVVHASKKTYKYSYAYTYDERGYPLTQTVTSPNGERKTYQYLYSN